MNDSLTFVNIALAAGNAALYDVYGEWWSLAAAVAAALTVIHLSAARP